MVCLVSDTDDLKAIVKSLLVSRVNSTLPELRKDYEILIGDGRLPINLKDLREFVKSIPEVVPILNAHGLEMWMVNSEKSRHIQEMVKKQRIRSISRRSSVVSVTGTRETSDATTNTVQNQKSFSVAQSHPPKQLTRASSKSSGISMGSTSTQKTAMQQGEPKTSRAPAPRRGRREEINNNNNRRRQPYQRQEQHRVPRYGNRAGYFYNNQLMGDDFMLSFAKIDLGYKFEKDPYTGILSIGTCISGMTIKDAARMVRSNRYIDPRIIVYVGSVDILHGRDLPDIMFDYLDLMSAFQERGIKPTVCTLAPLANTNHEASRVQALRSFNRFLNENKHWDVLDINECFTHKTTGNTIIEIYQPEARKVTGSNRGHVLWNKLGRQRVMNKLKSHLAGKF